MTKDQGLSLLDIGPQHQLVPVGDKQIKVYGVSAKGIFAVFQRFPEVGSWFKGGKLADAKALIGEAPDAIAAIIAAGCGLPGNEEAEETASLMPIETQLDILEAIVSLTFKSGFGPFVIRMVALSEQAASLNYGKGSVMTSPSQSTPASRAA